MSIFTVRFWRLTIERAVKSAAQGVLVAVGLGHIGDVEQVTNLFAWGPWMAGAGMAIASVLTSVSTAALTGTDDPSAVR